MENIVNDKKKAKPFKFSCATCDYEMSGTDDPYIFTLYRKDGRELDEKDIIPHGFYEMGLAVAMLEREEEGYLFMDYSMNSYLSEDKKQAVMVFVIEKEKEDINKEDNSKKEPKGIKRLFKSILRKN